MFTAECTDVYAPNVLVCPDRRIELGCVQTMWGAHVLVGSANTSGPSWTWSAFIALAGAFATIVVGVMTNATQLHQERGLEDRVPATLIQRLASGILRAAESPRSASPRSLSFSTRERASAMRAEMSLLR